MRNGSGRSISNPEHSERRNSISGFLRHIAWRAVVPWLMVGTLLLIAAIAVGSEIDRHLSEIEAWIASLGPWALVAFIVLFALATSCLVPDSVLCVVAGALFDLKWGCVAAIAGILLASMLQFTLSHRLLRPRIQRMLAKRPALSEIQRAVRRDEFRLQVLLRLTPLNPATVSYLLGAVGVRFSGFLVACLALVPALIIEVYVGHAGRHLTRLAGGSAAASRLHEFMMIGGLAMCMLVFLIVSRLARNAVAEAVSKTETADDALPGRRGLARKLRRLTGKLTSARCGIGHLTQHLPMRQRSNPRPLQGVPALVVRAEYSQRRGESSDPVVTIVSILMTPSCRCCRYNYRRAADHGAPARGRGDQGRSTCHHYAPPSGH